MGDESFELSIRAPSVLSAAVKVISSDLAAVTCMTVLNGPNQVVVVPAKEPHQGLRGNDSLGGLDHGQCSACSLKVSNGIDGLCDPKL